MLESGERVLGHQVNHCSTDAWVKVFLASRLLPSPVLTRALRRERGRVKGIFVSVKGERGRVGHCTV